MQSSCPFKAHVQVSKQSVSIRAHTPGGGECGAARRRAPPGSPQRATEGHKGKEILPSRTARPPRRPSNAVRTCFLEVLVGTGIAQSICVKRLKQLLIWEPALKRNDFVQHLPRTARAKSQVHVLVPGPKNGHQQHTQSQSWIWKQSKLWEPWAVATGCLEMGDAA